MSRTRTVLTIAPSMLRTSYTSCDFVGSSAAGAFVICKRCSSGCSLGLDVQVSLGCSLGSYGLDGKSLSISEHAFLMACTNQAT